MSRNIASWGLLMLPFAVGMATEAAKDDRAVRRIPRGQLDASMMSEGAVRHGRGLGMMMKSSSESKKTNFFLPPQHDTPSLTENFYSKGKGKGGGMMMMSKKKGKNGSSKYYYDEYYHYDPPTNEHQQPPVATFQILGCYTDVSEDGFPCIYSHDTDVQTTYPVSDACDWLVTADAVLFVEYFEIEDNFDFLTVGDVQFTSTGDGLDGTPVFAGDIITFESDMLNPVEPLLGFKVCLMDPV